jgi:hypothetical protein
MLQGRKPFSPAPADDEVVTVFCEENGYCFTKARSGPGYKYCFIHPKLLAGIKIICLRYLQE